MAVAMNRTTTNVVTAQLRGRRRDVAGSLFAAGLLSALLLSLCSSCGMSFAPAGRFSRIVVWTF